MDPLDVRVQRHPLYPSLVRRVARVERSWGRYATRWRSFERNTIGIIGRPYHFANDVSARFRAANNIARRMLHDVFPRPWPTEDDMIAAIYNVARSSVSARRFSPALH